ncbi:MAG TPA: PTS cellobiose transporter subunit IIC [Caldanaerobacter subterraneus]|jgi:PTS system cellobiose-specific IIC component|uniref:Permease IIC component n=1 Tax=Caldanaerobacter subterraneus TaxID=911092 RepID=A0A357VJT7_9THEO|nr:PTS cellobiose transporter subunit IIC [Caldanaerobacter subterraneus]HBT48633.1 PTS cellobiose transporter subunit IIC [Caldanaerobacter subterraneus]
MDTFINFLDRYFMPVAGRLAEQRHLKSIRDGIVATMPLLLIGSFFLIIAFPPVPALEALIKPYVNDLLKIVNATFGIIAMVASFTIAYSLAGTYKLDSLAAGILSLSAFMVAIPLSQDGNILLKWTGSQGLFVAILIAVFTVEMQRKFVEKNLIIRMPEGVPPSVARSFAALVPGFVILSVVWVINFILVKSVNLSIPEVINKVIALPLMHLGSTLPAIILAILVAQLLWSVGIHGQAIVEGIMAPIWISFAEQNAAAKAAGEIVLPHIATLQFFQIFVQIGGTGTTLALALLLLFTTRSKQLKAVGRAAIGPGLFNINEPITFGMPIVMNPIMIVPFMIAPILVALITYFAMALNIVGRPYALIPWTTPVLISGFLTTGDWKAIVLQIINFAVAGAVYYPFLKLWDNKKYEEEQQAMLEKE